jgi:hypothetical protein
LQFAILFGNIGIFLYHEQSAEVETSVPKSLSGTQVSTWAGLPVTNNQYE